MMVFMSEKDNLSSWFKRENIPSEIQGIEIKYFEIPDCCIDATNSNYPVCGLNTDVLEKRRELIRDCVLYDGLEAWPLLFINNDGNLIFSVSETYGIDRFNEFLIKRMTKCVNKQCESSIPEKLIVLYSEKFQFRVVCFRSYNLKEVYGVSI
jgi:hypothetical protein